MPNHRESLMWAAKSDFAGSQMIKICVYAGVDASGHFTPIIRGFFYEKVIFCVNVKSTQKRTLRL